jgi:hypothetical protein
VAVTFETLRELAALPEQVTVAEVNFPAGQLGKDGCAKFGLNQNEWGGR